MFFVTVPFMAHGGSGLSVTLQHKDRDSTCWVAARTFSIITGTGQFAHNARPLDEDVRMLLEVGSAIEWDCFHIILAPPVWRSDQPGTNQEESR